MTVINITRAVASPDPAAAQTFYGDVLGLGRIMDLGWMATYAAPAAGPVRISFMREGAGGAPIPDLSIEVDDADAVHARAVAAGLEILRPLADESWGVRRLFLRDPFGQTVAVFSHHDGPPG